MKTKFLPRTNKLQIVLAYLMVFFVMAQQSFSQVTHTTEAIPAGNVAQNANNQLIYQININAFFVQANSISFTTSGTYTATDIKENGFKVYMPSFMDGSDILIGTFTGNSAGSGESITITLPAVFIDMGTSFKIKVDISETATLGNTIKINGQSNPVQIGYIEGMPGFPAPIVTNNQTDLAGVQTISNTVTPPTPATLIANYTFCGNANDATSNAHNGVAHGVTATVDRHGNEASAYSFDGQDDLIDLGNWFTLQNFSISMWLKPGSTQGAYANIIDNNHSGSSQNWVCQQDNANLNSYGFGTMSTASLFSLTTNQWQQLVLVKSPTALETYVNGELVQSTPYVNGPINYSNQYLRLGNWGGGGRHWNGVMDDVKIYDGALTASEIATKYTEENTPTTVNCGPQPTTLVANYTFCGNANDTSPNANNGTVNGATLTTDRFGNTNSAYSFDGISNYIEIPDNDIFDLGTADYSLSYWMKTNSPGLNQGMIMKMDGGNNYVGFTQYHMGGNLQARSQNADALNTATGGLNDNNWHHVVYVRSGTSQKLYIDGSLNANNTTSGIANVTNSKPMHFGKWNEDNSQHFVGALDDIKIYSGALTESEITAEYNATAPCTTCPPNTTIVVTGDNVNNQCTASSTLQTSGGTAPYNYTLSTAGASITNGVLTGPSGTYTVTAFDANGCSGTAEITLIASDNIAPTFNNCPANITQTADANCTKVVTWPALQATDNCNIPAETIAGFTFKGSFNGKAYYLANGGASFADAKSICEAAGGKLMVIDNLAENNFVKSLGIGSIMMGITDAVTEGTWLDMDGNPVAFFNWNPGEPNNASGGTGEDFASTDAGGWNDFNSGNGVFFMEKGPVVVQTAGPASGSAFPIGTTPVSFEVTDVANNKSTCSFTVTINPSVTANITYNANAFCKNEASQLPTITGAQGGTFSFIPPTPLLGEDDPIGAGGEPSPLVLSIDPTTGAINPAQSDLGVYTVEYSVAASGACPAITANFTVQIKPSPVIDCPGNISVCKNEPVFNLPNIPSGATVSVGGVTNTSGTFDPSADWSAFNDGDGQATVAVVYSVQDVGGCATSCTYNIIVKRLPNTFTSVYFGNTNGENTKTVCVNSGDVPLIFDGGTGSMAPFTFTYTVNDGPEQQIVSPGIALAGINLSTATAGTFVYKLTKVKINNGCEVPFDKTATLTVNELPTFTLSGGDTFCEGENTTTTLTVTSATSGTITGTLTDGTAFSGTSPIQVTVSPSTTISYQIQSIDGTTCPPNFSGVATITVNPKPIVTCPANMSVCISASSFSPMVSPIGGIFSGEGIYDNVFNPALAGVGIHEITYSYTDENTGCTNICTFNITVTNTSTASLSYPAPSICKSETNFAATLLGAGGTFSAIPSTGLTIASNGDINPSTSTPGIYTVKYTIPASGDCAAVEAIATVEIKAIPVVVCPDNMSVCINQLSFELGTDGTYSGDGVENNMFNPQTAGLGNHEITLSKTVDGCTSTCTFVISVSAPPQITINSGSGLNTCEGGNNYVSIFGVGGYTSYSIEYNINGGNTQTASTGDGFITIPIPFNTAGEYNVTITKVDNGSGCPNTTAQGITIVIKAKPTVTCPANMSATTTDAVFTLTGATPTGGVYSGNGVSAGMFNPATAGVGMHTITYTITGENGCQNTCSFTIAVTEIAPCNVTLASFTAESVCQPLPIPLNFTGLVPNTTNDITLSVKEVLIPANSYADRLVTVTADALGNASTTLDVSGYQTVEYQLTVKEVKIGDCILNPVNITSNFNKKPRGGGQTLDILETAICSEGSLNGLIGTVPNQFLTNYSFEIRNTSTSAIVQSGTGVAAPNAGNTLTFSVNTVALPAGNYQFRLGNQEIDGCGTTAVLTDNFTVSPVPTLTATAQITNLDCNNSEAMGAIDLTVMGGSGTYIYSWTNGASSEDLSSLAAGTYTVTISDPVSCGSPSLVKTFEVSKPAAIVINIGSLTTACNGSNGTAVLSATGGNGGYIFSSSLGGTVTGSDFSAQVGTYTITATDSKGCTGTATVIIIECTPSEVICTNTQTDYGNVNHTVCDETGSQVPIGSVLSNALAGSPYVFGIPANNRTFTLSPSDLTSNIYSMLAGVSNASSKFGIGGASYSNTSTWSRVPLTNTGKIANNLFAHSMSLYFNLQNSTKLDNVPLTSSILHTESTLACGNDTPSGVVSSYQLPTGVISFLNGANGYSATVAGLYQLNNDALGGKTGLPNLSTLAAAADKVNKAFKGCRLIAPAPSSTVTFGTNIKVNEGDKAFDASSRGGLYMTLIEGDPATGHILGVVEVGSNGLSGFAPVITNSYHIIMGTDPEGSRSPQAPAGYRIVSQLVKNLDGNYISGNISNNRAVGTGLVEIGTFNPQAGARMAATNQIEVEFVLEAAGPLPVRLVSFNGKSTDRGNELNWQVSSEQNFSHYEVERSADAKSFEKIGKVDGTGNTKEQLNYSFMDKFSKSGLVPGAQTIPNNLSDFYYRLKMVDLDGKVDYSKTIFLKKIENNQINVYPNPAVDYIFVENTEGKLLNIRILDAVGKEISFMNNMSDSLIKVPVAGISSGAYFLQINDGGKLQYKKVIVNK